MMRLKLLCVQKQPQEVFYKKGVLKNFAKFTRKHQRQSLFCNKVAGPGSLCCVSDTDFSPDLFFYLYYI